MLRARIEGSSILFDDREIWFRSDSELVRVNGDVAALSLIFIAMREGRDLHIEAPVSRALLTNLEEFQAAWTKWMPQRYAKVALSADEETGTPPDDGSAVVTFSGGVDATFTLLRHLNGLAGRAGRDIKTAVLVHGYDILLTEPEAFEAATVRARRMLDPLGVPLVTVATNLKAHVHDWEMEYAPAMAAVLNLFPYPNGLVASGEDYGSIEVPWGGNPVTNPLLSGAMRVATDGTGFTRTEKVALVARYPRTRDLIRVCWEGPQTGRNCGRCEKCKRTYLNFLATGSEPGAFLDDPPSFWDLASINARNSVQISHLNEVLQAGVARGASEPWMWAVRLSIARAKLRQATKLKKKKKRTRMIVKGR
jgi:hypothetical protein